MTEELQLVELTSVAPRDWDLAGGFGGRGKLFSSVSTFLLLQTSFFARGVFGSTSLSDESRTAFLGHMKTKNNTTDKL